MFGMLSPASRGALMTAAIVLFMFMGGDEIHRVLVWFLIYLLLYTYPCSAIGGFHAARMYRTLKGTNWKKAAALVSILDCDYYCVHVAMFRSFPCRRLCSIQGWCLGPDLSSTFSSGENIPQEL